MTESNTPVPTSASSAAPYAEPSCVSSVTTRFPNTSASICRQNALFAPPPDGRTTSHRHAHALDDVQAVALAVGHAFDHATGSGRRAYARAVMPIQPPRAVASRCGVRSPIRYGSQNSPCAPAGASAAFGRQRVVVRARRELVAEPLQAQPRALRHAHHVPLAAHRMAERVDPPCGSYATFSMCANTTPRRAERARDDSRLDDPVADRAAA